MVLKIVKHNKAGFFENCQKIEHNSQVPTMQGCYKNLAYELL